eukprot:291319-Ditylum_brightwellii.AAC.1
MLSPKDTEAAETKDSRDMGKVDSGEEPPITDDDDVSLPDLMKQVLSDEDNEDSSNDKEYFMLSQEML